MPAGSSPARLPTGPDDPLLEGWYHTIELGEGIVSRGHFDHRPVRDRYGIPASLVGRSALDVGTGDGFLAFELERRGADPVTRELAVIETVLDPFLEAAHPGQPYLSFGVRDEESEPGRNNTYWRFTTRALEDMIIYAGFSRTQPQPIFGLPPHDLPATAVIAYA